MTDSRAKGARGERLWAEFCRAFYGLGDAHRTAQRVGTATSNDVVTWPGTHCECKFVEKLNVEEAMQQAEADCALAATPMTPRGVPYVAHKRSRTDWMVTVRAADLLEFCRLVLAVSGNPSPTGDTNKE